MASSRTAAEVTDRPAGDGAEGRPGGQKRDPGQDQGGKRFSVSSRLIQLKK